MYCRANLAVMSTATESDGSQPSTSANLAVAAASVATAPTLRVPGRADLAFSTSSAKAGRVVDDCNVQYKACRSIR
jgi:hypothetical protein